MQCRDRSAFEGGRSHGVRVEKGPVEMEVRGMDTETLMSPGPGSCPVRPGGEASEQPQGGGEWGPAKGSSQESTLAAVSAGACCGDTRRLEREVGATVFTAR